MRFVYYLLLLITLSCSRDAVTPSGGEEGAGKETTYVLGSRGGWGSETYFRYQSGKWYRSAYAGLRSNEAANKLNREALATDEANWELIGSAPAEVTALLKEVPTTALNGIEKRSDCPALAYDGGCAYFGISGKGEYSEWFGDFEGVAEVATFMAEVKKVVSDSAAE